MYLEEGDVRRLVVKLREQFDGAELVADVANRRVVQLASGRLGRGKFRRQFGLSEAVWFHSGLSHPREMGGVGRGHYLPRRLELLRRGRTTTRLDAPLRALEATRPRAVRGPLPAWLSGDRQREQEPCVHLTPVHGVVHGSALTADPRVPGRRVTRFGSWQAFHRTGPTPLACQSGSLKLASFAAVRPRPRRARE